MPALVLHIYQPWQWLPPAAWLSLAWLAVAVPTGLLVGRLLASVSRTYPILRRPQR